MTTTSDAILRAIVKPLKWTCVSWGGDGIEGEDDDGWEADVPVGGIPYRIDWLGHGVFQLTTPDDGMTKLWSLSDAKADAEADYRARIAASLNLDLIERMVEAAEKRGIEKALNAVLHTTLDDAGQHLPDDKLGVWVCCLDACEVVVRRLLKSNTIQGDDNAG